MHDEIWYVIGRLCSTTVAVELTTSGQAILVGQGDTGEHLASLLGADKAESVRRENGVYWRIVHDREVDEALVELIDLLISIRYTHPALVQLEMILEPGEL